MPPQRSRETDETSSSAEATASTALREPLLPPSSSPEQRSPSSSTDVHNDLASPQDSSTIHPHHRPVSRNVTLTLIHTAFTFAGNSIWGSNVLPAYVFLLTNNNPEAVGAITGCMGLANVLCSIPTGWFADSHRRDTFLKLASIVGTAAISAALFAIWMQDFRYLVAAFCLWGCTRGIGNTALFALFADSVPKGDRSYYFTQRTMLIKLGTTAGPITSLVMFYFLGDEWTVQECAIVFAVGQIVSLPAIILFSFFSDDYMVHEEEVEGSQDAHEAVSEENNEDDETNNGGQVGRSAPHDSRDETWQEEHVYLNSQEEEEVGSRGWCTSCCGYMLKRRIPILVAIGDVLGGFAGGMSIRFFPIFFLDSLKVGPVVVQLMYIAHPLVQVVLVKVAQRLSKRFGRLHVTVLLKWTGAFTMYLMIGAYRTQFPVWFVCFLFVLRTATANSTKALTKSVVMDNVPRTERARWSSLESINVFGWSGSAFLGGFLVGQIGFTCLFATTATLQIVSTFPLVALFAEDNLEQSSGNETIEVAPGEEEPTTQQEGVSLLAESSNLSTQLTCNGEANSSRHRSR